MLFHIFSCLSFSPSPFPPLSVCTLTGCATSCTQVCVCVCACAWVRGQPWIRVLALCCLRQDFLFTITHVKLAKWKSSRNSLCLSLHFMDGWCTAAALPELGPLIYLSSRLYSPFFFLVLRMISFSVVNHASIVPTQPSVALWRWPSQEHNTLPDCFLLHRILMNYLSPG